MKKKNQLIKTLNFLKINSKLKNLNYFLNFKLFYYYNFYNLIYLSFFVFLNFDSYIFYSLVQILNKFIILKKLFFFLLLNFFKLNYILNIKNILLLLKWIFLSNYKPCTPSSRWKINVKNISSFNNIYNSNFFFKKKKPKKNNIVNFSKKKNKIISNFSSNSNKFKFMSCLVTIKKTYNSVFYGVFKTIYGHLFLMQLVHGCFLGDFFKNLFLPIKLLKKNFLGVYIQIKNLPIYFLISNIFFKKNNSQLAKSSGTYCQLLELKPYLSLALLKLPSGAKKYIDINSFCISGRNSNIFHKYEVYAKASFFNLLGRKPNVRGVAKNPVDHPHGGRTKTNKPEVSPWGWVTKHSH